MSRGFPPSLGELQSDFQANIELDQHCPRQPANDGGDSVFADGGQLQASDERILSQPSGLAFWCRSLNQEIRCGGDAAKVGGDLGDDDVPLALVVLIRLDDGGRPLLASTTAA
jgi:hypothetical protein